MRQEKKGSGQYAKKLADETSKFLSDLRKENERLQTLIGSLKSESHRIEQWATAQGEAASASTALRQTLATLAAREFELAQREEALAVVRKELGNHRERHDKLQSQLSEIERENGFFADRYVQLERQASRLSNLYAASYRLHETLERKEVLQIIEEIVNAIIGSEELAVFERMPGSNTLQVLSASGVDRKRFEGIQVGQGPIGQTVLTGETFVAASAGGKKQEAQALGLSACIPLRLVDTVIGAIAIFRLLPQKPTIEPEDHELFNLLATQAAMALYCTRVHSERS